MEVNCLFKHLGPSTEYVCQVNSMSITQPNREIKTFIGIHEDNRDNNNVTAIYLKGSTVEFLPRGLLSSFPQLTFVSVCNCDLKSICREDLVEYHNLEVFFATFNKLTTLPSNLFIDKPKLKKISFRNNHLEFVSSQLLEPIIDNGLLYASFSSNTKIDADFFPASPTGVSLKQLMLLIDTQCSRPPGDGRVTENMYKNNLINSVAKLWKLGRFSDFTIVVNSLKKFKVHKNVLGSQSPVFAAMFETDMEENRTGEMKIIEFSENSVEQFLGFLYTGIVPDEVNAMDLFAIADKYDVPYLLMLSEKTILKNLCDDNAMEVFNFAHLYSSNDLKREAFKLVHQKFPEKLADHSKNNPKDFKILEDALKQHEYPIRPHKRNIERVFNEMYKKTR